MKRNNIKAVLDTNIFIAAWFEESTECEKIGSSPKVVLAPVMKVC